MGLLALPFCFILSRAYKGLHTPYAVLLVVVPKYSLIFGSVFRKLGS